jgi:hypothetical protein
MIGENKRMKKFVSICVVCLLSTFLLFGCLDRNKTDTVLFPVTLYFVNSEYVETGNENIPAMITKTNNLYCGEGEQYDSLLVLLRSIPDDLNGAETTITDKIKFRTVKVNDKTAYVDISSEDLSGGSLEEGLFISQIVHSLKASVREIEEVQFFVDGKIAESLMGHYDVTRPYSEGIYQ